jgi:hypothetical protein
VHLVLIETTGNQAFIFATNKLRENVGASELTAQVGTQFVLEAVRDVGGPDLWTQSMAEVRSNLRDGTRTVDGSNSVEVILAVSGKALFLVQDADLGRRIVSQVTRRALKQAPGLEVRGVISDALDLAQQPLHEAVRKVHRQFEAIRSRLPGPAARFLRLPIIAECSTSGLPAARYTGRTDQLPEDEHGPRSAQSLAKLPAREAWERRRDDILRQHPSKAKLPDATTELEKVGCDWLAIVHADGNGLGQVFLTFDEKINHLYPPNSDQWQRNQIYVERLRAFSLALDECTEKAFCHALQVLTLAKDAPRRFKQNNPNFKPIVPLVLGGDDLTVVCDGRQALRFTKKFIDSFEQESGQHQDVNRIMPPGVTSCAGVAIVKPHFPFFAGYQLAEELLQSAKKLGKKNPEKPLSAIDFHILYDASGPDLERIRRELSIGEARLIARPYLVRSEYAPQGRAWHDLERRIAAVRAQDDDARRWLPNSMMHELREGLFLGREAAEARLQLVRDRYGPHIDPILADDHLFWLDGQQHITGLLDAIDTAEFWEGQEA